MTHRALRGVVRTRYNLDITLRTLPPHCTYLLMIEIDCLGLSGRTQSMRVHAYTQANTRQILVHSSDSSDRLPRDRLQARSGWIRAGVQTSGWLMKRRGVHGERMRVVMTARSRAASSRHIARTSWHTTASSHAAGTRSAAWWRTLTTR